MNHSIKGSNNLTPDNSNIICTLKKEKESYILYDCNGGKVWNSSEKLSLFGALGTKTKKYYEKYQNTLESKKRIWVLGTKIDKNEWRYRNIAICINDSIFREINSHIKQLVMHSIEDKTIKAQKYLDLWNSADEIEFREVIIDKYIANLSQDKNSKFILSIIRPDDEHAPGSDQEKTILCKLRAEYIEGRLASQFGMRNGDGLWNPSGYGIDGDVYMFFETR